MGIAERWTRFRALPPDIQQKLAGLIPLFEREGVLLAYLFGSLAQDKPGHDVDLALLVEDQPAFRLRTAISDCLDTERLDLVDLERASPVLRFEVISTGRLLYARSPLITEDFEMSTLRIYKDTAWLRRRQREHLKERMEQWSSDPSPSSSD